MLDQLYFQLREVIFLKLILFKILALTLPNMRLYRIRSKIDYCLIKVIENQLLL